VAVRERCSNVARNVSTEVLALTETELGDAYNFVSQVASEIIEGKLTHKDKWLAIKVKNRELTLSCASKQMSCQFHEELTTASGIRIRVCPALGLLFNFLKRKEEEKKPVPRPVLKSRKVGRYLYKLQPNQGGNNYWYLQFTENGRSTQIYLGKDKPKFDPETDLQRVATRKLHKPQAMAAAR
jgi:hypothetical protein